ncbi:MAG: response regulator [bacterium]|nr:response regulator [bacterium]
MRNSNDSADVFEHEFQLLEKINRLEGDTSSSKDELLKEYSFLGREYDKLLRQSVKLTRVADANQRKLLRSLKLEQEKLQLQQILRERTEEIEQKNHELENQSKKLQDLSEIKSQFFANISHEFRTPLTLIIGPLEQMLSQSDDTLERKKFTLMLRNSQRLLGLINQLLDLSKLDGGRMELQTGYQDVVPFLRGIAASFEMLALQNELDFLFRSYQEQIILYFDQVKLEEIIHNLLLNAIKFTPPGGKITVAASVDPGIGPGFPEGAFVITVSDTGLGIPSDRLEHIFERFYQAGGYEESKHKGSGIGLALSKELVELHYGEIDVSSRQGSNSGTTFTVRIPLGKQHLKEEEIITLPENSYSYKSHSDIRELYMVEKEEKESAYGEKGTGRTTANDADSKSGKRDKQLVLVVEDSADVRSYVKSTLEPEYDIAEAADGRQGIDVAKEIIPDIIISDVMMPGVDGFELCRTLKNDIATSHIPIILLTAKASEGSLLEGLETGADDYITKPFSTKILLARIKNLIQLRRQLQLNVNREMTLQPTEISVSKLDKNFFDEMQVVIGKNMSDPEFNVENLCKRMYMSRATLYRKIQALSGESPTEYIRSFRLKKAAQLLQGKFNSVLEVAVEVGFSSSSYFTKCFREKFQQLPTGYAAGFK